MAVDPQRRDRVRPTKTHILDLDDDCLIAVCRRMNILDLHAFSQVSPNFSRIVRSFRQNGTLHMDVTVTNAHLLVAALPNVGRHIKSLFINFENLPSALPPLVMQRIQASCIGTLKNLSITQWDELTLREYRPLLAQLQTLHLEACDGKVTEADHYTMMDKRIAEVLMGLEQLEVLSLIDCDRIIEDEDMAKVLENKPKLRQLQIMQMSMNGYVGLPVALKAPPNLECVTLHLDSTKRIELSPLADLQSLRSLHLVYYYEIQDTEYPFVAAMLARAMVAFRTHVHLEELVLHSCRLDTAGYTAIGNIKSIRHIAMRKNFWGNDEMCRAIAANTKYRTIDLFDCIGVTNEGIFALLAACPELHMLDASWCAQLSTPLLRKAYDIIAKRPQTPYIFELYLGGAVRIQFDAADLLPANVGGIKNIFKFHYDPLMGIELKPVRTMQKVLEDIENEKLELHQLHPSYMWRRRLWKQVDEMPNVAYMYRVI